MKKIDCEDSVVDVIDELGYRIGPGKRGVTIGICLNPENSIFIDGYHWKIRDLLTLPKMDLSVLRYDFIGTIKAPFKKNFYSLPLHYRYRLFELLYAFTRGTAITHENRFNENFAGIAENLSLYYKKPDSSGGYRNLYLNIRGIGNSSADGYLRSISRTYRLSGDPNSPIWISKFERFISDRFLETGPNASLTIFEEIQQLLGTVEDHIQLSVDDLDQLIAHYGRLINYDLSSI